MPSPIPRPTIPFGDTSGKPPPNPCVKKPFPLLPGMPRNITQLLPIGCHPNFVDSMTKVVDKVKDEKQDEQKKDGGGGDGGGGGGGGARKSAERI